MCLHYVGWHIQKFSVGN